MRKILAIAALLASAAFIQTVPARADDTAAKGEVITVYMLPGDMGLVGPDKQHHDTFAPSTFVVHKGQPVTLRVINYDDAMHSITATDLGVAMMIKAGIHVNKGDNDAAESDNELKPEDGVKPSVTTYTFTPTKVGEFRWHCIVPCDGGPTKHWSMSQGFDGQDQDAYMAGYFVVM